MYICKYFGIKELVSKAVYNFYKPKYGESFIWRFFDEDVLKDLDKIRETYKKPIIINNWSNGGNLSQCGLRCNIDPLVKSKNTPYLSAHCLACGFDLHCANGNHKELYNIVYNLIKTGVLKRFKRLENFLFTPSWVHVDGMQTATGGLEVFNP